MSACCNICWYMLTSCWLSRMRSLTSFRILARRWMSLRIWLWWFVSSPNLFHHSSVLSCTSAAHSEYATPSLSICSSASSPSLCVLRYSSADLVSERAMSGSAQYHDSCQLIPVHDLDCSPQPSSSSLCSLSGCGHPAPASPLWCCLIFSFMTSMKFSGSIEIDCLSYSCILTDALLMIWNFGDLSTSSMSIESSSFLSLSIFHSVSSLLPSSTFSSSMSLSSSSSLLSSVSCMCGIRPLSRSIGSGSGISLCSSEYGLPS